MNQRIHFSRKLVCLLLALTLVLSVFAGLTLAAFAHTGTAPDLPAVNTKVRHQVCTSLSSQAAAYYTGQYTYAQMSQLSGVNNAEDCWATTQNNPLYNRLQTLMSSTHTFYTDYSGTSAGDMAYYWTKTDAQNSSSTYYCFYTDLLYDGWSSNAGMQREHIWPKSNASYKEQNGGSDMHHLRPSVGTLNNSKSNNYFGEIHDTATANYIVSGNEETKWWSDGGVFEPKDSIKGDIARILLYVYCRWGQPNLYTDVASSKLPAMDSDDTQNNGTRAIDGRAMLLRWMENDPVDTWEMERNDRVQDVQGNRNVFIDYPEYAWLVFGLTPPSTMTTPSGMAAAGGTSYTISATTNNSSYGTVSLSGSVITAIPASGYYAAGYQVTSGSATVTQSGNTFTVNASTNCTVQIIFAQIQTYTVTYMANGYNAGSATAQAGSSVTLPSSTTAVSGWDFIGWTDNAGYTNSSTQPANYYAKGTGYTVNGNVTLYAVYTQTTGGGTSGYALSTAAPTNNDKIILARQVNGTYYGMTTAQTPSSTALTVNGGVVSSPDSSVIWDVSSATYGVYLKPTGGSNYLHMNSSALKVASGTTNGDIGFSLNSDNQTFKAARYNSATADRWIVTSGTNSFGCSGTESNAASLYIFKYTSATGTTTYSINPSGQQHTHSMSYVAANPANCTADGNSAYYYCADCGGYFTDAAGNNPTTQAATVIAALGHDYVASVTQAATCGAAGVRTYTCTRCSDSYTETIPATGAHNYVAAVTEPTTSAAGYTTYTCSVCGNSYVDQDSYTYRVTYLTPNGVAAPASVISGENTLVTPPTLSDTNGWTFVGWVKNSYDNVTTAPTEMIFDAENKVHVTNECLTLRALFTKTETTGGGTPVTTYELVDSASDVDEGTYVITWENSQYFPSETTASKNPAVGTGITVSNDKLTNTVTSDMLWTFTGNNSSGFSVTHTAGGTTYYLGAYNNAQGILVDTTGATTDRFYSWTASDNATYGMLLRCSDGGTRNLAVYTPTSGTPTWRYYTTGSSYKGALRLYKETTSGGGTSTTTYTTVFPVTCAHENLTPVAAVAATCETAGNSAYWICDDCGLYFADAAATTEITLADVTIAALGHAWGTWQHVDNSNPSTHTRVCGNDASHTETASCTFDGGVVTVEPTYTSTGVKTYTCSDCGWTYVETIPMLTYSDTTGGSYKLLTDLSTLATGDKVVIYNPANAKAMTSTLYNSYYLTGADATVSDTELTPADNTVVWTVTKNQDGSFTFTQGSDYALYGYASGNYIDLAVENGDGYINKWELADLDTEYDGTVSMLCQGLVRTTSTTTYNNVYLEYYNSRFQVYGTNNELSSADTAFGMQLYVYEAPVTQVKGVSLTLNGQIDTNAYLAIPDEVVSAGVTPVVTYVNSDGETVTVSSGNPLTTADKAQNGLYMFTAKMPAKDMNTKVRVRLLQNGQPMSFRDSAGATITEYEYCVQDYLQQVITDDTGAYETAYPGLTALCKAMSDYGYAAQQHFDYNTDVFPVIGGSTNAYGWYFSDGIAAVNANDVGAYTKSTTGTGVKFHGASLILESETTIRFYFTITGSGSFTATVDGASGKALTRYGNTNYWYIDIKDIAANDLDEVHTVTVTDGTNSATVTDYGAYTYVKKVLDSNATSDALKTLAKALKYYGKQAETYFG